MARGGALAFLQRLTDSIGGRVTGSAESRAAADLLLSTLREAGFEDAHFEDTRSSRAGSVDERLGASSAPVRATAGRRFLWLGAGNEGRGDGFARRSGRTTEHRSSGPSGPRSRCGGHRRATRSGRSAGSGHARRAGSCARPRGAAAMLIPSDKPNRMLYTSAFGFYPGGPLPVLSVAKEDVLFLRRLLASGPVRVTLDVANTIDASPAQERNVVADIKGTTPGEVVLVGAHFDSWDPGQGAQDDGVGVAAILEAARILKSLGIKPRRTIRFAFFSGEEQALLGSRAYVERAPQRARWAARSGDHGLGCANAARVPDPRTIGHRGRREDGPGSIVLARCVGSEPRGKLRHGPWAIPGGRDSSLYALGRRGRVRHAPPRGVGHLRQSRPANAGP